MRWRRDLLCRRWAHKSRPKGRPPTRRNIKTLALCMARENEAWGYRRIAGELAGLGIKVAPSTVWAILKKAGIDPAPRRTGPTWASFLRSQAEANPRHRLLHPRPARRHHRPRPDDDRTRHPTHPHPGRHRAPHSRVDDSEGPQRADAPVMNTIQERRHRTVRTELLDRTLAWNIAHLRRVLAEYETFYNEHRPHRTLGRAAPPRPLPDNVVDLDHFRVARRGRIGGTLHEYLPEVVRSLRPIRAERETLLPRERLRHPAVTTAEPRCFRFIVR